VDLGPTDGGFAAVLSGLQPGERVVTDGTDRLREGVAVAARVQAPALGPKEETGLAGQEQQHKEPSETHPVTPAAQSDQQSAEASKALNRTQ
jgi:membrane fusion protein, multidrug efflux system